MAKPPSGPIRVHSLEGNLNIFSIQQQWMEVQVLLEVEKGTACLDLASVGDLDQSGLQLICALEKVFKSKEVEFRVVGAKGTWKADFASLGLGHLLEGGTP